MKRKFINGNDENWEITEIITLLSFVWKSIIGISKDFHYIRCQPG
jgi:hypothetical protein